MSHHHRCLPHANHAHYTYVTYKDDDVTYKDDDVTYKDDDVTYNANHAHYTYTHIRVYIHSGGVRESLC